MGTSSSIRLPGAEQGRYVRWDGYPSGVGQAIWQIVQRDGLERARQVLCVENPGGWSSLNPLQVISTAEEMRAIEAKGKGYWPPSDDGREYQAWSFRGRADQLAQVEGYGTTYLDDPDGSTPGEAWNYTLADDALVIEGYTNHRVPWDGPEPVWEKI